MKLKVLLSLCTFVSLANPALAWWDTGHMMTAQIAYDNLKPEVKTKADKLIHHLDNSEPDAKRHHFVPVSVWMDDTKARGLRAFDQWHYINIPFNPEGLPFVTDAKETNIVAIMDSMAKTLKDPKSTDFEKAFALRILLHVFGDIHQPYHAIGKVSHEHIEGDLGGNKTLIQHADVKNIHAFWDSTAGLFPQVSAPDWQSQIPQLSASLQQKFPRSGIKQSMDYVPLNWAQESYKLAVKFGYDTLPADGKLTQAYILQAQAICEERIVLGGYRLADFLNSSL